MYRVLTMRSVFLGEEVRGTVLSLAALVATFVIRLRFRFPPILSVDDVAITWAILEGL